MHGLIHGKDHARACIVASHLPFGLAANPKAVLET
jgi:hypothetical protein